MGLRLTFLFCATVSPIFASVGLAIVGAVLRPPRNNSFARRREKKSKDRDPRDLRLWIPLWGVATTYIRSQLPPSCRVLCANPRWCCSCRSDPCRLAMIKRSSTSPESAKSTADPPSLINITVVCSRLNSVGYNGTCEVNRLVLHGGSVVAILVVCWHDDDPGFVEKLSEIYAVV